MSAGYAEFLGKAAKCAEWVMQLPKGAVLSRRRGHGQSIARACVAYAMVNELDVPTTEVARLMRLDPSSISYMIRSAEKRDRDGDWDTQDLLEELIELAKRERLARTGRPL